MSLALGSVRTGSLVLWLAVGGASLVGCASAPQSAGGMGSGEDAALDVAYPEALDGFSFRTVARASSDASWGTQITYASGVFPDTQLDVFAYHVGFTEDNELVISQYEAFFPKEIGQAVEAGSYTDFSVHDQGRMPITANGRTREGAWFHFQVKTTDQDRTSITHFHYRPPFAVKIRASHPDTLDAYNFRAHIADFATQVVPRLEIRPARGCDNVDVRVAPDAGEEAFALALEEALLHSARIGCHDYDSMYLAIETVRSERARASKTTGGTDND